MKLRRGAYTIYKGEKMMLYRSGDINKLVVPIYDEKQIDDKCIEDEWGGYILSLIHILHWRFYK